MKAWLHDGSTWEQIIAKHGPWSAMSIGLPGGRYTLDQAVDHRLKRLVQSAADMVGKPLSECRVLDLACLEGHYGIEFALQGAQAVCVEIREANLVKTAYAVDQWGLKDRCHVYQDDVRHLNPADYGQFDIIVCSGILYHLPGADAADLLKRMHDCCTKVCIVDTFVAVRETATINIQGEAMGGMFYSEHTAQTTEQDKLKDLWASIDNNASFWFTHNALVTLFGKAGFTSCSEVQLPTHPGVSYDRRTYAALKGRPVTILSSAMTQAIGHVDGGLEDPSDLHSHQVDHGAMYRLGKTMLPQGLKDAIKPALRAVGVLKTFESPFKEPPK
jgi:2-polyprenyl-3-methyl-5-hydroxy-6-metoxy-1,4-benzoquinol methylase